MNHVATGASPVHASEASAPARSAAVDLMARTSGGQVLAEANHPSGKLEVAVAIGTDPAVTFSAIVPAPPEIGFFTRYP